MQKIKRLIGSATAGLMGVVLLAAPAAAATGYSLFGEASLDSPGNGSSTAVKTVSDADPAYGGIDFDIPAGTSWTELATVSADYNVTDDDCAGGSPRLQLDIDTDGDGTADGTVHVAIGPSPNFTDCATGWQSTGNLIGNEDAGRYDFSQFGGSTFTTYSAAPSEVQAGDVVGIQLVTDGSWNQNATNGDGEQTVLFDNVVINGTTHTFEAQTVNAPTNKDQCKKDGWKAFNGRFKNQGDCVSYVSTNGRNQPALANF